MTRSVLGSIQSTHISFWRSNSNPATTIHNTCNTCSQFLINLLSVIATHRVLRVRVAATKINLVLTAAAAIACLHRRAGAISTPLARPFIHPSTPPNPTAIRSFYEEPRADATQPPQCSTIHRSIPIAKIRLKQIRMVAKIT